MDYQTLFLLMTMTVVVMAWWENYSKRGKIYCRFRRPDKTLVAKFVKMVSRYVVWDGKKYDVDKGCIVYELWNKGLVHTFFHQNVATLDFTHESRWPIDPETGKPAIISPEVRNAMNKEEWVKSYAKGFVPPSAKKQTMFQQWLPLITIGLVFIMGVYFYVNMQSLGIGLADIANKVNSTAR